jgi:rhomboid family protein
MRAYTASTYEPRILTATIMLWVIGESALGRRDHSYPDGHRQRDRPQRSHGHRAGDAAALPRRERDGVHGLGIGTCVKHRDDPHYASLGASGAILAVLFASIVYFPRQRLFILPIPIPIPAPLFALAYLAFSYYSSRHSKDRINHDAHIFGALTGIVFVLLTDPQTCRALLNSLLF